MKHPIRSNLAWCGCMLLSGIILLVFTPCALTGKADAQDLASPATAAEPAQNPASDPQKQLSQLESLQLTSQAFRAATKRMQPSLVSIESFGGSNVKAGRIGGIRKQGEGNTTGVVISSDGYILTSTFNFIREASVVTVRTKAGDERVARILGRDDTRKICLLKIDNVEGLVVPDMQPLQEVKVGQWAISIGVGYGDQTPAISMGIVSAKNRVGGRAIQTDANISPANYGGPLVDIQGRLIGICVPMNPQSQAVAAGVEWYDSGIGFAVPVDDFKQLIERLKGGQKILPAFIGITTGPVNDGDGMRIEGVAKESAAEKAGLVVGDVLLSINAEPINDMLRLRQVLNRFEAGQKITVSIRRTTAKNGDKSEKTDLPDDEPKDNKTDPSDLDAEKNTEEKIRKAKTEVVQITMQLGAPPTTSKPEIPVLEEEVDKPKER